MPQPNTIEEKVQRYSLFNVKVFAKDKSKHSRNVFDGYLPTRTQQFDHLMMRNETESHTLHVNLCVMRDACTVASKSCTVDVPKETNTGTGNNATIFERKNYSIF